MNSQQAVGMSRAAKKRAKNKKRSGLTPPIGPSSSKRPKAEDQEQEQGKNSKKTSLIEASPKKDDESVLCPPDASLLEILLLDERQTYDERKEVLLSMSTQIRAKCLLQTIINPVPLRTFYAENWEKKPLLVRGNKTKGIFQGLLSLQSIRDLSKTKDLFFGRDLNLTRYEKGDDGIEYRRNFDKAANGTSDSSKIDPDELWAKYEDGCTIRFLCPHEHADNVHALLSTLELELQCMVGANAYLTPPNASQGFAPHYDDIEAFCLQLEGRKRWKVYEAPSKLPRQSSEDFTAADLEKLELIMDITLEEGDVLYMPRGYIHQACTLPESSQHSLHLTVSAMQQWAWADLLEFVFPEALEATISNESNSSLRQGLPRGFLDYMGAMYQEPTDDKLPDSLKQAGIQEAKENSQLKMRKMLQEEFRSEAKKRIMKVAKQANEMIDAACDELGKRFLSDRQPFALTEDEEQLTSRRSVDEEILPNSLCRLVRPGIARLVIEDSKAIIYHCGENTREFHGNPLNPLEFELDDGAALEQLVTTVEPHWIFVNDLFHDTIEDKIAITRALYDEGILAMKQTQTT